MPFETAYELYYRPLVLSIRQRGTAWGLSEQDVDVEALVQDTFEQALSVWDSIRVPRAWLYTVARRRLARCISTAALRADGDPADHTEQGTVGWSTIAPSAGTQDLVAAREIVELIQLMPQQRRQEVAYLRYIEGWGFNEIAEQLGCCPATARVHALNARGHLVATASGGDSVYQAGRDMCVTGHASGSGCGWLVALLVLGCVLAAGFLVGWSWVLAAAGGVAAVALAGWAWSAWRARRRGSRQGRRRLR
ncbi:sigma-70 family RNA polymerase sigma factor (plasmid) [Streptomyces sp. NBC_00257]|uniref:RNA polymerase sigma factor n=1 Tax=unclassified Streptomyces TaxID=2593676 RepID=UPI002254BA76|nr:MULTISPECIES: sigma-70 family RNA polymerase sigma factor [unclassified Streptomyces]MCX5434734.1 sigma-70 family RNA polymerase sigma factor [Streptomyces sp. NBC_00062]